MWEIPAAVIIQIHDTILFRAGVGLRWAGDSVDIDSIFDG